MHGDLAMISVLSRIWTFRCKPNTVCSTGYWHPNWANQVARIGWPACVYLLYQSTTAAKPETYESVMQLVPADCVLAGVDFHCSGLMDHLKVSFPQLDDILLKDLYAAVWTFRSSLSRKAVVRRLLPTPPFEGETLVGLFSKYLKAIDVYSVTYLRRYFG